MRPVWRLKGVEQSLKEDLVRELGVSPVLATLLINRGVKDVTSAQRFLHPSLETLHSPFLLKDLDKTIDRTLKAVSAGEEILIWGDEDVDGITSTVIMYETLRDLGSKVSFHIPSRIKEGFGLNKTYINKAFEKGVRLIITVDCGLSDFDEVTYAKSLGMDVIITDHHQPLEAFPEALAVINPRRKNCSYPFKNLAGAGVAYKVAQGIAMKALGISPSQWHSVKRDLLPLVFLGAGADRMELLDENRVFAKSGLDVLRSSEKPWVKAVKKALGQGLKTSSLLGFLVPILSAGRAEEGGRRGIDLLLAEDYEQAERILSELISLSQEWHNKAIEAYSRVRRDVQDTSSKIIVVVDKECTPDVLGYCASRLKEQLRRPVVVIGFRGDCAVGEARAPSGFDLMECLKACDDLFMDYGGHKGAAGFSIVPERIDQLSARLRVYAEETIKLEMLQPRLEIDMEVSFSELDSEIIKEITTLAPFWEGNPEPLFLTRNVYIEKSQQGYHVLGRDLVLLEDRRSGCHWPYYYGEPVKVDVVYSVDEAGALFLKDFKPSGYLGRRYKAHDQ